jgi:hypothetical protein
MSAVAEFNAHDELLEWASEMSEGSWSQWRDACRDLGVEATQSMLGLAALGHVEVDWTSDRFSCPPPTAAFLHRASGCVLLTGARPRGFLDTLNRLSELDDSSFFMHDPRSQTDGPCTLLIEVELEDAQELCAQAGLEWVFDPAWRVAEQLPTASLQSAAHRELFPPREDTPRRKFNPSSLRFDRDGHSRGLWFYDGYRRQEAWLCDADGWWMFPTREYAPYLAHPDVKFLTHHYNSCRLQVPSITPLPPLQARSATLASGRLPREQRDGQGRVRIYENLSLKLALRIAQSLGTELEERP